MSLNAKNIAKVAAISIAAVAAYKLAQNNIAVVPALV